MANKPDSPNLSDVTAIIPDTRLGSEEAQLSRPRQSDNQAYKEKQREYLKGPRLSRTANNKRHRSVILGKYMALKINEPGLTQRAAADRLNMPYSTLRQYIQEGTADGSLRFDSPLDRLENEIIPKVLDNLKEFVDKKDRVVTLETAKGTVFKQFQAAVGIVEGGQHVLALKIEMTGSPTGEAKVVEGQIVGKAKELVE